ncbi:MAG: hypothetical protein AABZ55_01370 [Bdellovibrionota bacterium]
MQKTVLGYITSNSLRDGFIPHQIQNLLIKNFVEAQGHRFFPSWSEYKDSRHIVFESLMVESFFTGICFYSIEQYLRLPDPMGALKRLSARKLWIGFARENMSFMANDPDVQFLKLAWLMSEIYEIRDQIHV